MTLIEYCAQHPESPLLREWDPEANGSLTPAAVQAGSSLKAHWKCAEGHTWQAVVYSRTEGRGCPYCAGLKPVPGENDLATTHPALAAQWHPTKNGKWTPRNVSAGSHRKVVWLCEKKHEWSGNVMKKFCGNRKKTGSGWRKQKGKNKKEGIENC